MFHSIDIESGEPSRVKFKIDMHTDNEIGTSVHKQNFTPILLQGSNHWKSVVLMDPDYNNTKFSFDRFTDGFIPRLLFVQKKFSAEINKKLIERVIRKKRLISERDIKAADLQKMFGNHLFKFFYKVLQLHARVGNSIDPDNLRYLGLEAPKKGPENLEKAYQFDFDCNELFDVFYGVLESNKPFFVYEFLEFLMVDSHGNFNIFSMLRNLLMRDNGTIDDARLLIKFYSQSNKDGKSVKNFESNLYKIKNKLHQQLKFNEREKKIVKNLVDNLRVKQRLPDPTESFPKLSEYKAFTAKLKMNEVVLPTLLLKIANNCKSVKEQILSETRGSSIDQWRISEIISENHLVKEYGLSQLILFLIE